MAISPLHIYPTTTFAEKMIAQRRQLGLSPEDVAELIAEPVSLVYALEDRQPLLQSAIPLPRLLEVLRLPASAAHWDIHSEVDFDLSQLLSGVEKLFNATHHDARMFDATFEDTAALAVGHLFLKHERHLQDSLTGSVPISDISDQRNAARARAIVVLSRLIYVIAQRHDDLPQDLASIVSAVTPIAQGYNKCQVISDQIRQLTQEALDITDGQSDRHTLTRDQLKNAALFKP